VDRLGFQILEYRIQEEKCPKCGSAVDGVDL
jgi:rRNA maturation protein Nop10